MSPHVLAAEIIIHMYQECLFSLWCGPGGGRGWTQLISFNPSHAANSFTMVNVIHYNYFVFILTFLFNLLCSLALVD